jgi:hypothetical protein
MESALDSETKSAIQVCLYLGGPMSPLDCLVVLRVSIGGGRAAKGVEFCGAALGGLS